MGPKKAIIKGPEPVILDSPSLLECEICPYSELTDNEVRFHRSTFTKIGARPGSYVRLSSEDATDPISVVCQAFIATGFCASIPIFGGAVSTRRASLLGGKGSICAVERAGCVENAVFVRASYTRGSNCLPRSLAAQLVAQLRAVINGGIVSTSSVFTLVVLGGIRTDVTVTAVVCAKGSTDCGIVGPWSTITVDSVDDSQETKIKRIVEVQLPSNVLFQGDRGVGKSYNLIRFARECCAANGGNDENVFPVSFQHVSSVQTNEAFTFETNTWSQIQSLLETKQFLVVLIDDIDVLLSAPQTPFEVHALRAFFKRVVQNKRLAVAASCTALDKVPAELRDFFTINTLAPPSESDTREAALRRLLGSKRSVSDEVVRKVAEDGHGYNQADLQKVCKVALSVGFSRTGRAVVEDCDLLSASRSVRPSVLNTLEVTVPNVSWSDIGGSDDAKVVLKECVEWCLGAKQSIFSHLGLPPPKGVLLYGPPGCSKTMLAKALAKESGMNFVSVKGPEVFSKWVGDSEKAVRDVFRQARAAAPCVVFIDELDGMCGHRGSGGVGDRVISQLLTELDGLPAASTRSSDSLIFVAATNRPENIDAAVLRPGRIDRKVFVGLPTEGERKSIASIHLSRIPCDSSCVTPESVAARTEGYTGAEVVAVCKEAAFQALGRSLNAERVEGVDMDAALLKVRPRVSPQEVEWYLKWGSEKSS